MQTDRKLPDFDDPPVVETVLGVEFEPLQKWSVPHFGVFWKEIEAEYPRFEIQPPLDSRIERFGDDLKKPPGLRIELLQEPKVRCWFHDTTNTRLIQVQPDRFVHNWRKHVVAEPYPHYENIRPVFAKEWARFCEFTSKHKLGTPVVIQCEVSYVNHIDQGKGWTSLADVGKVVNFWGDGARTFLPAPETVLAKCAFQMPGQDGRLHVDLQHAIRNVDLQEILQLTLTARGRPQGGKLADILAWMDRAREWVVQGFADITTPRMHYIWKRKV